MRCSVQEGNSALRETLDKFWTVEEVNSKEDVVTRFQNDIFHNGSLYVTKLPVRPDHDPLPDNFEVCKGRLKGLKKRLMREGISQEYGKIIEDYEKAGIIKKVPHDQVSKSAGDVHYLPHRPVIREDRETTKIRFLTLLVTPTDHP